jgi:hypothetical protein
MAREHFCCHSNASLGTWRDWAASSSQNMKSNAKCHFLSGLYKNIYGPSGSRKRPIECTKVQKGPKKYIRTKYLFENLLVYLRLNFANICRYEHFQNWTKISINYSSRYFVRWSVYRLFRPLCIYIIQSSPYWLQFCLNIIKMQCLHIFHDGK